MWGGLAGEVLGNTGRNWLWHRAHSVTLQCCGSGGVAVPRTITHWLWATLLGPSPKDRGLTPRQGD